MSEFKVSKGCSNLLRRNGYQLPLGREQPAAAFVATLISVIIESENFSLSGISALGMQEFFVGRQ